MKPAVLLFLVLSIGGALFACGSDPSASSGGSATPESCGARAEQAARLVKGPFDSSCESASDCTIVQWGNGCSRGCDGVLSKTGAEAHEAANDAANAGPCKNFVKDRCPQSGPSCQPPPQGVACEAGKCVAVRGSAQR